MSHTLVTIHQLSTQPPIPPWVCYITRVPRENPITTTPSTPSSVQELLEMNNEVNNSIPELLNTLTPEQLVEYLMKTDWEPTQHIELMKRVTQLIVNFHNNIPQQLLEKGDVTEDTLFWFEDRIKMNTIHMLMKDIWSYHTPSPTGGGVFHLSNCHHPTCFISCLLLL